MTETQTATDLPEDFVEENDGTNGAEEKQAADAVPIGELSVQAPDGAHWDWSEVKTARGTQSLGEVPILAWDSLEKAQAFYGEESALAAFNNTGLRVPFQSIARRGRVSGKLDANGIAQEQLDYRPGQVERAQSTPASRAKSAAARAAETLGGESADVLAEFLNRFASGQLSIEQLRASGLLPSGV
jgi:hypothetical protein